MSDVDEQVKDIIVEELGVEREKLTTEAGLSSTISAPTASTPSSW